MISLGTVVVLLGGESTGKSSLAKGLCQSLQDEGLDAVVVPEYLRQFCAMHGRTPRADEQPGIADTQTRRITQAARKHAIVLADTSALMTAVYSACLFGDKHLLPHAIATQQRYAATLLTALDLPWVADGLQRDGPQPRQLVDTELRRVLVGHGLPFSVIHGSGPTRLAAALAAVRMALQNPPDVVTREHWRWICPNCDGSPSLPLVRPDTLPS